MHKPVNCEILVLRKNTDLIVHDFRDKINNEHVCSKENVYVQFNLYMVLFKKNHLRKKAFNYIFTG